MLILWRMHWSGGELSGDQHSAADYIFVILQQQIFDLSLVSGSVFCSFILRGIGGYGDGAVAVLVQRWTLIVVGLLFLLFFAVFPLSPLTNQYIVVSPPLLVHHCHRGSTTQSHQKNEEI